MRTIVNHKYDIEVLRVGDVIVVTLGWDVYTFDIDAKGNNMLDGERSTEDCYTFVGKNGDVDIVDSKEGSWLIC
jgi:hypothetical protein